MLNLMTLPKGQASCFALSRKDEGVASGLACSTKGLAEFLSLSNDGIAARL